MRKWLWNIVSTVALCSIAFTSAASSGNGTCKPSGRIADASASYATLDTSNTRIKPVLSSITRGTDFFGYYRLDLFGKECPFWQEEGLCGNRNCAVETIDDEADIPETWRASALGKLAGPSAADPARLPRRSSTEFSTFASPQYSGLAETCIAEEEEENARDFCVPEDESAGSPAVYVSLENNPERFTGYSGPGANKVWEAIYRENCFNERLPGASQIKWSAFGELEEETGHMKTMSQETCLEKRVFYRILSGMHASISTHLCYDYLNQTTGKWGPNLECFIERVGGHEERMENLYFNYALLLRAVMKLRDFFPKYTFCSGDVAQDRVTKVKACTNAGLTWQQRVLALSEAVSTAPELFDESLMFVDPATAPLIDDFRTRFRNVSRLMDCVGCDRCRLWGKVQTSGYGTALKILFDFQDSNSDTTLRRTELVALVNTLDRLSHSLEAVKHFRDLADPKKPPMESDFRRELRLVIEAFAFVFHSWIHIPSTLWRLSMYHSARIWESFIGREYVWVDADM